MISYLFVLLMMVIGGVIGFLADSWGHKIGKKRLSFMGLRPRHTATLVTVGAGVLIPLVTVIIVAILSSGVREWLFRGQRAIEQTKQLEVQVNGLEEQQKRVEDRIREKTALSERLDARLKAREAQVKELEAKVEHNRREASIELGKVVRLTGRVTQIRRQLEEKQKDLAEAKADLAKRKSEYKSLQTSYAEASRQLKEIYAERDRLDTENDNLKATIAGLKKEVAGLESERKQTASDLQAAKEELKRTTAEMQVKVNELQAKVEATAHELADTDNRLSQTQSRLGPALSGLGSARTQPMIFSYGEELARVPLEPDRSSAEVEACLESLLRSARILAESRGAKANATQPAAGLIPLKTDAGTLSVAEQESQIVSKLTGNNAYFVLVAYSQFNAFKGEWVQLTVRAFPNPVVYRAGQVIAETIIDGRQPEKTIVDAIGEFIRGKVTDRARAAHMIPIEGREAGLGSVPTDDLLALLKQVRDSNQRVRVRAEAAQDTRAADPLKLKLTVR